MPTETSEGDFNVQEAAVDLARDIGLGKGDAGGEDGGEGVRKADAPEAPAKGEGAAPATGEAPAAAARGPDGKFLPGAAKPAAADGSGDAAAAAGTVAAAPAATTYPKTWKKDFAAEWDKLPEGVRGEVLRREEDFHRGIEQYRVPAQVGQSFYKAVEPYLPVLRQHGMDPVQHASHLLSIHHQLFSAAKPQKVELFKQLINSTGMTPAEFIQLATTGQPASPGQPGYVDPAVEALRADLQALKSTQSTVVAQATQQELGRLTTEVEKFAADPKHPYFDEVAGEVQRLLATRAASTLPEAYQLACHLSPVIRAKMVAGEIEAQKQAAAKLEADRVAKAKQAASTNSRAVQKNPARATPNGSGKDGGGNFLHTLDQALSDQYDEIQARQQ